jgi:uncharacterized protein YegP (UPF0339 family)
VADTLTFYQSEPNNEWRWRYQAEGNAEKLANGGESYHSLDSCVESAFRVCGLDQHPDPEVLVASGFTLARANGMSVEVQVEASS